MWIAQALEGLVVSAEAVSAAAVSAAAAIAEARGTIQQRRGHPWFRGMAQASSPWRALDSGHYTAGIKQMALVVVVVGTEFRRTSLLAALCRFKRPLLAVEA